MMAEAMLLPPTDTPQSGIDFTRRLPSGEYEKTRKIMRVFFAFRALSQKLCGNEESELPLTPPTNTYKIGDVLDTSKLCEKWGVKGCWEQAEKQQNKKQRQQTTVNSTTNWFC